MDAVEKYKAERDEIIAGWFKEFSNPNCKAIRIVFPESYESQVREYAESIRCVCGPTEVYPSEGGTLRKMKVVKLAPPAA
jgi:hypothetical protein